MELDLLQVFTGFGVGVIVGVVIMLVFNKVKSGSASPASVKQEFDDYKNQVEEHFEATSKKFQNMTEQYQDLYQHLSVGATSLCRPDSVAAGLVDDSNPSKPKQLEVQDIEEPQNVDEADAQPPVETQQPETEVESEPSDKPAEERSEGSDTATDDKELTK